MRKLALVPVIALLALTACGEDQTAEAPAENTPPPVAAAPPAETERPTASTPPASTSETTTASKEATPGASAPGTPPPAGGEAISGSAGADKMAATTPATAGVSDLKPYLGRTYAAGPVSLQLNEDRTFILTETGTNNKVEGKYTFKNGVVTFSQPTGDVGSAKFPITCRIEGADANSFSLADTGGSCQRFHNLTFKPQAG